LNNEANVRTETQEKVRKAIEALNYSPSLAARTLAGSRSFLIGLLYDTPSSYYIHSIQVGALERCREAGFHLILEKSNSGTKEAAAAVLSSIRQTRMDGVILTPPVSDSVAIRDVLVEQNIPYVLISPPKIDPGTNCVYMEDQRAAFDITAYLISLGHSRIAFIKGHPRHGAAKLRLLGYREALRHIAITPNNAFVKEGNFRFQSGVAAAEELLQLKAPPTAILAANDEMAAGVIVAAHRLGLKIPDDISVAGFDDVPYASITWPALTTIRQPISEMGAEAASLLLRQLPSGESSSRNNARAIAFQHELKIRESTGPARKR
jgi:LacI family transcriptional regulator